MFGGLSHIKAKFEAEARENPTIGYSKGTERIQIPLPARKVTVEEVIEIAKAFVGKDFTMEGLDPQSGPWAIRGGLEARVTGHNWTFKKN